LLDFDCYSEEKIGLSDEDLPTFLDDFHEAIEAEFKAVVTEKYWNFMEHGGVM